MPAAFVNANLRRWPLCSVRMNFHLQVLERARALNSAVECHLHTVEVIGSNPIAPTISIEFLVWL